MSDIQSGKHVRIRDIADALGVSTATVSNVIHNKTSKISAATIDRVQKALDEFGYAPNMAAISLAQKRSHVIGVVVGATRRFQKAMLTDPFIGHMLDSISTELEAHGYSLMLCRESNIANVPRNAHMWNWAGAMFIGFSDKAYEELSGKMPVPYMAVDGGRLDSEEYASTSLDNYSIGWQAAEHLISKGHRKICYMTDASQPVRMEQSGTPGMRYFGLADAMAKLLPGCEPPRTFHLPSTPDERIAAYDDIYQASLNGEITAVFSVGDLFAVELLNHLTDAGVKLPEALSVLGCDDVDSATIVRPRLSTFHQDMPSRGKAAVTLLLNMVEKTCAPRHIINDVQMVCRDSVADINISPQK